MKRTALLIFVAFAAAACGRVCAPKTGLPLSAFCVPDGGAPAGLALTLMARENCGGCAQTSTRCDVAVAGHDITLTLSGESCTMPPGTACADVCRVETFTCAVPALAAGQYTVTGTGSTTGPKSFTVADGGSASCAVAAF